VAAPPARLRAVLFDLDGTLTQPRSSWRQIHEELRLWSGRADAYQEDFRAGRISYEEFCRLDAREWAGLPVDRLRGICDAVEYHDGAADMVAALKSDGLKLGIVSTGLSLLADRVREELGLDYAVANALGIDDGRISGEIVIRVPHGGKDAALKAFCLGFGLDPSEVAAVGDTEGDISMFEAAGWSVAFNPESEAVARRASAVVPGRDLRDLVPHLTRRAG